MAGYGFNIILRDDARMCTKELYLDSNTACTTILDIKNRLISDDNKLLRSIIYYHNNRIFTASNILLLYGGNNLPDEKTLDECSICNNYILFVKLKSKVVKYMFSLTIDISSCTNVIEQMSSFVSYVKTNGITKYTIEYFESIVNSKIIHLSVTYNFMIRNVKQHIFDILENIYDYEDLNQTNRITISDIELFYNESKLTDELDLIDCNIVNENDIVHMRLSQHQADTEHEAT